MDLESDFAFFGDDRHFEFAAPRTQPGHPRNIVFHGHWRVKHEAVVMLVRLKIEHRDFSKVVVHVFGAKPGEADCPKETVSI